MSRKSSPVTLTEQSILDVLWSREAPSIREIVEAIYPAHTPALHSTVKSLLDRLASKGYVTCDTTKFVHRYAASITRDDFVSEELVRLAGKHFGGALTPLLISLVEKVNLTRKDRETIQKILETMPDNQ